MQHPISSGETSNPMVAIVTGASKGLGRGIARAFGTLGLTTYITGRDSDGSLRDAAAEVEALGGRCTPIACDHRDDDSVAAMIARVIEESGRIDVLVNNAAAVYRDHLLAPGGFWEKPLILADMIDVGLRSSYVAAWHAARHMVGARSGLIANISFYGAVSYFAGPAYGATKAGVDKMSHDMAIDLAPHGVAAVAFWPGLIRTDAIDAMAAADISDELRARLPRFERPEFSGLVLAALARDRELMALSGRSLIGAELGSRYGILDIDGKQPLSYRDSMGDPDGRFLSPQPAR